ncbi:signal transduction histidine kinase [Hungatella effluvii]|uniref:Circadian input-output histidine kinase CikA n=1 Tax=Hungatella effluvii TaxID=1096246 RepID=A0A2V3Y859_9FIRM|nr:response regulator [Hungatella effluvii]PXX43537.1 signal transduction histidine kinase [Hungatella effluvii]
MELLNEALKRTGYEYDTLMNLLQVSVSKHILDEYYTLVWCNDYYYELIGYAREEYEALFHNRPAHYYVNDDLDIHDEKLWLQLSAKVMETLESGEKSYSLVTRMRRKHNGNHHDYIWVRLNAYLTDEYVDGYQVSYSVMTDITDVMDMRLEQSVTYDNLPGFVSKFRVSRNLDFKLLEANDRFFSFFGKDSMDGMDNALYRENMERNMQVFLEHKSAITNGNPIHFTVQMKDQSGNDAWLQINASCIGYQEGDPVYLAIYIDITNETELRQMQQKLEAQAEQMRSALKAAEEANRAKSDFLSRMSHDIRTPLNAVLGMKDIADAHLDDPAKVKDCLRKIGLSGQHLLGLINDVLDMSKIESGEMVLREDSMSLPEVLENVVAIMQPQFSEKAQHFSIRLRSVVHEQFSSDALRMRQIFINILSNAYKFTPVNGTVSMEVCEKEAVEGTARFSFTITDTGIGMKPEYLSHIFTAFSREKDSRVDKTEGTGLGMAITQKFVDMMDGTIEVSSELGKGTCFKVELPLKIEESPFVKGEFSGLRILVTDDDAAMCEYMAEMLGQLGIHTDWVDSGVQTVERIKTAKQNGEMYDAVLLDWKMPDLDGFETTRRIRELCGNRLPVLIISAYDWSDVEKDAKKAGVTGFLQKPIFVSTLIHGLQRYVLGGQEAREAQGADTRAGFAGRRFLLIEDNTFNQEIARELLSDMGAVVDTAGDGAEGVEKFGQSPDGFYDVILMDVQMPVMNGYEATKAIRALDRDGAKTVPILAMTADAFAEDIQAAKDAGMNGHMAKPLDKSILWREIGKYLNNDPSAERRTPEWKST